MQSMWPEDPSITSGLPAAKSMHANWYEVLKLLHEVKASWEKCTAIDFQFTFETLHCSQQVDGTILALLSLVMLIYKLVISDTNSTLDSIISSALLLVAFVSYICFLLLGFITMEFVFI